MFNKLNICFIPIILLFMLIVFSLFYIDHMTPINSLKIKYNKPNIIIPNKFNVKKCNIKTEQDKINTELNKQPLEFNNQMYSFSKYPYIGSKQYCKNNNDCSQITSECNFSNDSIFNRESGIGICTLKEPDKTIFDIKFQNN